ncbi:non-homologous end joining protein Ku [Sediminibacterium soli]|uniref:non-homologous end joining protein Ku n=1 Tax=Sediminibacterium soli TaxID=2698829 RepID=UPI00137B6CB7|nr:Ku protein [Sediminibacterium soli]NCI45915.1 Ku protein [Sediminibacterium soli]
MRSLWTGNIGFGLVTIPVKLYSAVEDSRLDLDMLDKKDHANIRFMRVNEHTGKEVGWDNIVKGYDYNGKYVVLTDKDFEQASPEKNKTIDIFQFTAIAEIDSIYFEAPYFAEPDKNAAKPYRLLRDVLEKTGTCGIGSFVLRNKETLAAIKPYEDLLLVNRIRFQQEIRDHKAIKMPANTAPKPAEIKMATELIKSMTSAFDISAYKDTYAEELMKIIKAKAKGVKPKLSPLKVVHKQGADLMEQLKASLGTGTKKKKAS